MTHQVSTKPTYLQRGTLSYSSQPCHPKNGPALHVLPTFMQWTPWKTWAVLKLEHFYLLISGFSPRSPKSGFQRSFTSTWGGHTTRPRTSVSPGSSTSDICAGKTMAQASPTKNKQLNHLETVTKSPPRGTRKFSNKLSDLPIFKITLFSTATKLSSTQPTGDTLWRCSSVAFSPVYHLNFFAVIVPPQVTAQFSLALPELHILPLKYFL